MAGWLLDRDSERLGRAPGFEQLTRRAVGIIHGGPNALVHLGYPCIHGNEPNAEFVLDRGAQEDAVNLDGPGLPQWDGTVGGRGLARRWRKLVQVAPYIPDEMP
jgi:hypothetical protein